MAEQLAYQKHPISRSRRGESNALRRGQSKIHRRYTPQLCCAVPRGIASRVVARVGSHDWHRNADLIALRRNGYVPYTRRNDPSFIPKPMRISARSESCEALTALSLVLAANSDYPFEIMAPFEQIAHGMGMLHVYDNGRKAYDSPLHALSVLEQLEYVVVLHGRDTDSGQNKPLRLWLTEKFFTSRGIVVDEIREWLGQFRQWAIRKGLTESLRKKYERHLLRIERIGIDLKDKHSLRNRLRQIKRWVVSPDLNNQKQAKISALTDALAMMENTERLDTVLDEQQQKIASFAGAKARKQNTYHQAFIRWSTSSAVMPYEVIRLQRALTLEQPGLLQSNPESYYRLLLERAGAL